MSVKKHYTSFRLSNNTDTVDTVIGCTVVIDGPITSRHPIKVDGIVHGSVKTKANVFIGPNSEIDGDIHGKDITICGRVNGDVCAKGRIIISSKARVTGNMTMEQLVVDEGASFNGTCCMSGMKCPEEAGAPKADDQSEQKE